MINREHPHLSVVRQCELLDLSRSTLYYQPQPVSEEDLALMRRLDELHLQYPFFGSRKLTHFLKADGFDVGRRHVVTLMRRMGLEALYRKPRTSLADKVHPVYPYLLRDLVIDRPNQVWATDIT